MLSRSAAFEGFRAEVVMSCEELRTAPVRRRSGAFTLMEMLVVASIIVVIIAILLPAIGKARESGRRARCVSNMTQLGHGLTAYCLDNNGAFPATASASGAANPADWIYWRPTTTTPAENDKFYFPKSPIVKALGTQDEAILRCPADDIDSRGVTTPTLGTYKYSYVMNYLMTSFPAPGDVNKTATRLTGVKSPASKVLLYEEDEATIDDGSGEVDVQNAGVYKSLLSLRHERGKRSNDVDYTKYLDPVRHANVLFCDGHIDLMSQTDLHNPQTPGLYTNPTK
jgi:prepilin-type processing-associated H-X9-DG protein